MSRSTRSASRIRYAFSPPAGPGLADGLLVRSDPVGARLLEQAVRSFTEPDAMLSRLSAIWLWGDEIVVELADSPVGLLPDRWRVGQNPRQWFLSRDCAQSYEALSMTVDAVHYSCLVAVGRGDGVRLLLNLDTGAGLTAVTGPEKFRDALLGGIAAELATTQWSRQVRITCVGLAHDLLPVFPDRLRALPDVAALIESLASEVLRAGTVCRDVEQDTVLTGRAPRRSHPEALPHVILLGIDPSPHQAQQLAQLAARGGVMGPRILVSTARDSVPGSSYEIEIAQDGRISVPLLGIEGVPDEAPPRPARSAPVARAARPLSWSAAPLAPSPRYPSAGASYRRLTVITPGEAEQDVLLEADDAAPVSAVVEQLARLGGHQGPNELFTSEGQRLALDATLAQTPLCDGCRVFLGRPPDDIALSGDSGLNITAEDFAQFRDLFVSAAAGGTLAFDRPQWSDTTAGPPENAAGRDEPTRSGASDGSPFLARLLRGMVKGPGASAWHAERDRRFPAPHELMPEVFGPLPRLWERGPDHPDHLVLRVGLAAGRPTTVALRSSGTLGIVGDSGFRCSLAGWLVAQVVLLHPPSDVAVRVLTDESGEPWWRFARWLPPDGLASRGVQQVRISRDLAARTRHLAEAALIIRERQRGVKGAGSLWGDTALVIVLDGRSAVHSEPWAEEVLRDGPDVGVYVICLAEEEQQLHHWCGSRVVQAGAAAVFLDGSGAADTMRETHCRPDGIEPARLGSMARVLAPLRDLSSRRPDAPAERLLDLLDLDPPTADGIVSRWAGTPPSAAVVLGGSSSRPFVLDLRTDGPHALVAGMVGSGKDELLCTWLASLAVANRPDELNLLFVHHDNGEPFGPVAQLPHTVGVQTGVDRYSAARGLAAFTAELKRRQELIKKDAGARDFEQYAVIRATGAELPLLPRLVVVVSDLAALREELPEFVSGLIGAARPGPELGVHVVLATHRPSEAVTRDVLEFAPLRVVLRLADPADSELLIGTPAAAWLDASRPEFAYVGRSTGQLELVRCVRLKEQHGGRSGRPHHVRIHRTDWAGAQEPPTTSPLLQTSPRSSELDELVRSVREASDTLDLPEPHVPWPPPLPLSVQLKEALGQDAPWPVLPRAGAQMPVVFGLHDAPDTQGFQQATWDLEHDGHLLVSGDAGSGRTQLLLTLATAVAEQYSAQDVHLYAIDCDAGALAPLADLAHCGAVVTPATEPERTRRLIDKLVSTVRGRQERFARMGFRGLYTYRQQQRDGAWLPYIVLLLDGWEEFCAWAGRSENTRCVTGLLDLLRDSRSGICLVITGGEKVPAVDGDAMQATSLLLRQNDRTRYERAGLSADLVPPVLGQGRVLYAYSGAEVQIALPDLPVQVTAAESQTRNAEVPLQRKPFTVQSSALVAERFSLGPAGTPVGRENVFAQLYGHYRDGTSTALLGPRRAGKSWIVKELQERMRSDAMGNVQKVVTLSNQDNGGTQDDLAVRLMPGLAGSRRPADELLDQAAESTGSSRMVLLLDEVGRLASYDPAAVSWLRDLGQAGAWLVYCGTDKDWGDALRRALEAPGSSFGNDVTQLHLRQLKETDARTFLMGTAVNEGVAIPLATADSILAEVGTWPFYLQVVGEALVRAARDGRTLALDHFGELRRLIERELIVGKTDGFRSRWNEIGPAGREALLERPGSVPPDPSLAQRKELRDVGLLSPDGWLDDRPLFAWVDHWQEELKDEEKHR
jgi:DNA segregation ATPase FtsK/SpoIIIE, S-DNA-T family